MAAFIIKEEPIDYYENDESQTVDHDINRKSTNFIEQDLESELIYLNNVLHNVLNSDESVSYEDDELFKDLQESNILSQQLTTTTFAQQKDSLSLEKVFDLIDTTKSDLHLQSSSFNSSEEEHNMYQSDDDIIFEEDANAVKMQQQLQVEKSKILASIDSDKKQESAHHNHHLMLKTDPMSPDDEERLLKMLTKLVDFYDKTKQVVGDEDVAKDDLDEWRRLRNKLKLRKLKRSHRVRPFELDSYVNELIDSENIKRRKAKCKHEPAVIEQQQQLETSETSEAIDDDDIHILYDTDILKTTLVKKGETVCRRLEAMNSILDRFVRTKATSHHLHSYSPDFFNLPVGLVENRFEDIKCVISPFTNRVLKPYVRRDFESVTPKLELNRQIHLVRRDDDMKPYHRRPIDYVHIRPEHVLPINSMCRQYFWSGIDVSDCLNYPDYTLIALYRKLIVGFAFMVPSVAHKEAYMSFIFVHPDWRALQNATATTNCSIAQFLMYYLIKKCQKWADITLHVSCTSPAVLFYQKFGFKIEEFIKNFYEKYYSDDHNLSKDAFFMRLSRCT